MSVFPRSQSGIAGINDNSSNDSNPTSVDSPTSPSAPAAVPLSDKGENLLSLESLKEDSGKGLLEGGIAVEGEGDIEIGFRVADAASEAGCTSGNRTLRSSRSGSTALSMATPKVLCPPAVDIYSHIVTVRPHRTEGVGTGVEHEQSHTAREDPEPSRSCPAYLRWARHLHALLQDSDGVALFRRYLESEGGSHVDALEFWFACEGLRKQTDSERVSRLVKAIYRRYFLKAQLGIGEELRKAVNKRIKDAGVTGADLDAAVFDRSQKEVERLITETTYPNFLQSDLYLHHIQVVQNGSSSSSSQSASGCSSGSSNCDRFSAALPAAISPVDVNAVSTVGSGCLATVHEDCELDDVNDMGGCSSQLTALPLTRDMLLATQKRRATELRPKPEAFAGLYLQSHGKQLHSTTWVHHSSYNPVSRQDSELQSLSSDARTESDNMSMTDSSIDGGGGNGFGHRYSKKQYQLYSRQMKEAASLNRDSYMHHMVIPRTQRLPKEQAYPMKPDDFAAILIEKLESVKRDQETKENLDRKLIENSDMCGGSIDYAAPTSLADAIREKLQVDVDNDNDQDILDQHVSRVWSDRTPGLASPPSEFSRRSRPMNPPLNKISEPVSAYPFHTSLSSSHHQHHTHQTHQRQHQRHSHSRKERDMFSTFSSDSGNVHDFTEGSEHRLYMTKSKSMPEYCDVPVTGTDGNGRLRQSGGSSSSRADRDREREWSGSGSRRWSSKKTELTDSGVSVVSDTPPVSITHTNKDSRVLSWLLERDKQEMCGGGQPTCGSYSGHSGGERDSNSPSGLSKSYSHRVRPGTLPSHSLTHSANKTGRGTVNAHSRSGSSERTGSMPSTGLGPAPAQPFVADPSMPPLPSPHTPTQLEEARRRLLEDDLRCKQPRQRYSSGSGSGSKVIGSVQPSIVEIAPTISTMIQPSSGFAARKGGVHTGNSSNGGRGGNTVNSAGAANGGGMHQSHAHVQQVAVPPESCTTVVFSFCDEQFPYRTKIPGRQVTLRQFKEYLPKKGLYRYFFKTECDEVDTKVIHEEIVDDNEVLPLWEGKVMAQVKPVE